MYQAVPLVVHCLCNDHRRAARHICLLRRGTDHRFHVQRAHPGFTCSQVDRETPLRGREHEGLILVRRFRGEVRGRHERGSTNHTNTGIYYIEVVVSFKGRAITIFFLNQQIMNLRRGHRWSEHVSRLAVFRACSLLARRFHQLLRGRRRGKQMRPAAFRHRSVMHIVRTTLPLSLVGICNEPCR